MSSKSKVYCSVPQCSNYISKTIRMHKFPTDLRLSKQWQIALKIGKLICKFMYVCSEHFLPSDYIKNTPNPQRRHLKKGVIPSQKIPQISHESVKSKSRFTRKKILVEKMVTEETNHPQIPDTFQPEPSKSGSVLLEKKSAHGSYGKFKEPIACDEMATRHEDKGTQTEFSEFLIMDLLDTDNKLKAFTSVDHHLLRTMETSCSNVAQHDLYDTANLKLKIMKLMKLKLNISFVCLAVLFQLPVSTCTNYFYTVLELLSTTC